MKRRFLFMVVLTLLAVLVLVVLSPRDQSSGVPVADDVWLPELAANINDVNRVEIISAGNHTVATLVKSDNAWLLEESGGYRANWVKLRGLLGDIAQARVIEKKTDKPAYYARLGVEDISAANAGGVLVKISFGQQTTGVLVGHSAEGRTGRYVRLQGAADSALVDRQFDVSSLQLEWIDSSIVDINAAQVAEVEVIHPAAERLLVTRVSADQTDFDLLGLPQGREIRNSWSVNSLASIFSMLNMETVKPADNVDWADAVRVRVLLFSGMEIMADAVVNGDEYLLRLRASHPAAAVVGEDDAATDEQRDINKRAAEDVQQAVDNINQKVLGWAYGITQQKYDVIVRKPEDLLKPMESE